MSDYRQYCESCSLRAQCEYTFGAYWNGKSDGGKGCNHPISPFDLDRIKECASVVKPADVAAKKYEPDAEPNWIVTHRMHDYPTFAPTSAKAINNVRFNLYGTRPLASLPPFTARRPDNWRGDVGAKPSQADILERLKNMRASRRRG